MIKHIVLWKLYDSAEGRSKDENAKLIKSKLESLKEHIKEVKELEAGINLQGLPFANYDVALYSVFEDEAALEAYQRHPLHQELVKFINKLRSDKTSVDYLI